MIPKNVIEKAIEGGWKGCSFGRKGQWVGCKVFEIEKDHGEGPCDTTFEIKIGETAKWKATAHLFYDLILEGKDTDAFWQDIIKNNTNCGHRTYCHCETI